jgi:hypothetical protein
MPHLVESLLTNFSLLLFGLWFLASPSSPGVGQPFVCLELFVLTRHLAAYPAAVSTFEIHDFLSMPASQPTYSSAVATAHKLPSLSIPSLDSRPDIKSEELCDDPGSAQSKRENNAARRASHNAVERLRRDKLNARIYVRPSSNYWPSANMIRRS